MTQNLILRVTKLLVSASFHPKNELFIVSLSDDALKTKLHTSFSIFSGFLTDSAILARFEELNDRDKNSVLASAALWHEVFTRRGIGGRLWGGQEG